MNESCTDVSPLQDIRRPDGTTDFPVVSLSVGADDKLEQPHSSSSDYGEQPTSSKNTGGSASKGRKKEQRLKWPREVTLKGFIAAL